MIVIDNKYEIGDYVYLTTDPNQFKRIVAAILYYKGGELLYKICCGREISEHYDFEISLTPDMSLK